MQLANNAEQICARYDKMDATRINTFCFVVRHNLQKAGVCISWLLYKFLPDKATIRQKQESSRRGNFSFSILSPFRMENFSPTILKSAEPFTARNYYETSVERLNRKWSHWKKKKMLFHENSGLFKTMKTTAILYEYCMNIAWFQENARCEEVYKTILHIYCKIYFEATDKLYYKYVEKFEDCYNRCSALVWTVFANKMELCSKNVFFFKVIWIFPPQVYLPFSFTLRNEQTHFGIHLFFFLFVFL